MNRANCGSNSGWMSHYRRGETPCEDCTAARREYGRQRTAARRKPNTGKCVICEGPLTGQQKVTCSPKCRRKRNNSSEAFKKAQARYRAEKGREQELKSRDCAWCGESFLSRRKDTRFCSIGHYHLVRYGSCKPVCFPTCLNCDRTFCSQDDERFACSPECSRDLDAKTRPAVVSKIEWRTERECPGCGCHFSPLRTPNMVTCSKRCSRRVHRWRRKAAERGATGAFTWSEFMRVARKFDYCCAYCGDRVGQLDPDHVVPLSRGGSNSTANLLPSCRACNTDKNAHLLHEWAESRAQRGLPPRRTNWPPEDRRYWHLTDAMLRAA